MVKSVAFTKNILQGCLKDDEAVEIFFEGGYCPDISDEFPSAFGKELRCAIIKPRTW